VTATHLLIRTQETSSDSTLGLNTLEIVQKFQYVDSSSCSFQPKDRNSSRNSSGSGGIRNTSVTSGGGEAGGVGSVSVLSAELVHSSSEYADFSDISSMKLVRVSAELDWDSVSDREDILRSRSHCSIPASRSIDPTFD
jgi:hypothetical protein